MGFSNAVQWWEEWQLRLLVLGSLVLQYSLLITAPYRKFPLPSYFRPFIWFVFLGSDALAIYALATLFNRHKNQDVGDKNVLEVVWAPILLIHLGGQDSITAYNIEDNELWMRHVVMALSQITIAIYVFCKSWPGGDKRLLQAAILLFVPGILKCLEKPWALNTASINSLVSTPKNARRTTKRLGKTDSVQEFVQNARSNWGENAPQETQKTTVDFKPSELFVDLASPSSDNRLSKLLSFSALDGDKAYYLLQNGLSDTFDLLYTKEKMFPDYFEFMKRWNLYSFIFPKHHKDEKTMPDSNGSKKEVKTWPPFMIVSYKQFCGVLLRELAMFLPFVAIGLFHQSHRDAYDDNDVKVTYTLLCCTAVLELYSPNLRTSAKLRRRNIQERILRLNPLTKPSMENTDDKVSRINQKQREFYQHISNDKISQYNLLGYFVRNRKHSKMMNVAGFLRCKDYLDQCWKMKSSSSSHSITNIVLGHVKCWWRDHITDVTTYRMFNDIRGQWTLQFEGCFLRLGWSLAGSFDESVLLWHLATDVCYHISGSHEIMCTKGSSELNNQCPTRCRKPIHHKSAVQCREMSNYMMYLLFVNPEMLMPGTRRNLFTDAYNQLKGIVKENNPPLNERELVRRINVEMQQPHEENESGLIDDAWSIAEELLNLQDKEKMWRVIEGVWIEMLCFSAARCRGYLHAKSLGTGGEFLSYVWLLLHYMGMETLAEKLARAELPNGGHSGEERVAEPSTSYANEPANGDQHGIGLFSDDGIAFAENANV